MNETLSLLVTNVLTQSAYVIITFFMTVLTRTLATITLPIFFTLLISDTVEDASFLAFLILDALPCDWIFNLSRFAQTQITDRFFTESASGWKIVTCVLFVTVD